MLERSLEILVRSCPQDIFTSSWKLIAQQLTLPSGRIDLLFIDDLCVRQLVELKKGRATKASITQVLRYREDLSRELNDESIVPWVVANEIPPPVADLGIAKNVRTLAVSRERCMQLVEKHGFGDDVLLGVRRASGVLHGGTGKRGVRTPVANAEAYRQMPGRVAQTLKRLEKRTHFQIDSGGTSTSIHYRGVKLGGINRKDRGGHGFIAIGVVINPAFERRLAELGFHPEHRSTGEKTHEHNWWEISWVGIDSFDAAIDHAVDTVDRALRV